VKRYILAPEAARDLVEIWRYVKKESSQNTAEQCRERHPSKAGVSGWLTTSGSSPALI
jgi:plasmid stabilization system protein ParE